MCVRLRLRGVVWDGGSLAPVGGPHARPELDAITRSGSLGGLGSSSRTVESWRRRAGGGLFDPGRLDLNTSPAREQVSRRRWLPGFLPPNRGAWSWAPAAAGELPHRRAGAPGWGLGPNLPAPAAAAPAPPPPFLPSFLRLLLSLSPRPAGTAGTGRGGGCLGAYCWSDAEGPDRSPRAARRQGTQACGRPAGWLRAAAVLQRPRIRGMSGHWLRRAPPPPRDPLRCRSLARPSTRLLSPA